MGQETANTDPFRGSNTEFQPTATVIHTNSCFRVEKTHAESAYQPDAQSPKGAQGLMQLMPEIQAELGVANPFDPADNISGGARYLSQLMAEFNGNLELAAAAYNAGSTAVYKYGGVPPYEETQEYVRRVKILYRRYGQVF